MTQIFNKRSQVVKRRLLRRNAPSPEYILWQVLRNRKVNGQKFKRQVSIGRYVVDFYCPALRLAVEIEGGYHTRDSVKKYDFERRELIESLGINFLRFSNEEIEENIDNVIDKINSLSLSLRRRGLASSEG